jgi:hypothetical protein
MLRRIFGPKENEVIGEWRRLHNEMLNAQYSSPNIIWVIKLGRLRCVGYVGRIGKRRGSCRVWWGNLKGGHQLEEPGINGWIILTTDLQEV